MRFLDPWFGLLFLPLAAGLWFSFRHVHGMTKATKRLAFAVRAVLAGLLIFALMGPQLAQPNKGTGIVFVVDFSDSIRSRDREAAYQFVKNATAELGPDDQSAVVIFGRTPVVEASPGGRRDLPPFASKVDGSASDVGAALRLASAIAPEGKGKRAVILTDGNETEGDASEAVQAARASGMEVDFVPLSRVSSSKEAAVVSLAIPQERRKDEPFEARVSVQSSVSQSVEIVLDRNGVVVERRRVALREGLNSILIPQRIPKTGFFRYRAIVEPDSDGDSRNNVGAAFIEVKGRPRILLLSGPGAGSALGPALRQQGLEVTEGGPGLFPNTLAEALPYDAVVLNDVNAADVAPDSMEVMANATRSGGIGLAMIGGENSFLPGGWYGSPIAEILPVDLNVKQRKTAARTSVLIMVDASGSMGMIEGGIPKIRLAAKAAEAAANLLLPMDRLGVGGSSDGIVMVLPFTSLNDKPGAIAKIRTLDINGGGIFAQPTIERASALLDRETSKVRHFILVADGADTSDYGSSLQIVRDMKAKRITTSVVAIGKGKDLPFLQSVAAAGGGGYYLVESANRLPAIFTKDISTVARSAIEEGVFYPRMTGYDPMLEGFAQGGSPPLYAYCLTDSRPLAQTLLRTEKDDPLLAVWRTGLGRSLAFTSDAQPRWAKDWVRWGGFSTFWAQGLRSIMKRSLEGKYQVEMAQESGRVDLTITSPGGGEAAPSGVVVAGPGMSPREVELVEEAPGVFKGSAPAPKPGSYLVTLSQAAGSSVKVQTTGFVVSYPQEYRSFAAQLPRLKQLAELGKGRVLESRKEALRPLASPGESTSDIWFWAVLAAALLLPFDVATRRIALPFRELLSKAWARLRPAKVKSAQAVAQDERLSRLKSARTSVRSANEEGPSINAGAASSTPKPKEKKQEAAPPSAARDRLLEMKRKKKGGDS